MNSEVIVFDLDGTLYADTHHFDYYAERLKEKLPEQKQMLFEKDYKLARADQHTLKIGCVYDAKKDLILKQLDHVVQSAYHWEGRELAQAEVKEYYPVPIIIDLESMFNVGDLWWIPGAIARYYGLNEAKAQEAFLETRSYMMGPDFEMIGIPGLKEVLEEIYPKKKLVLLTNSPEPDSEAILEKLGLNHLFHKKIFSGKKPTLTTQHFQVIKHEFEVEYPEILSVGDNWINEIRPAQKLGCQTLFIDAHHLGEDNEVGWVVNKLSDGLSYLKE